MSEECPHCGCFYTGMTCECAWQCCFPGKCIAGYHEHMSSECMTAEMAEDYYEQERKGDGEL